MGTYENKKARFIEELRKMPNIAVACQKTGIKTPLFYRWTREDERFFYRVCVALELSREAVSDRAEQVIIDKIGEGSLAAARLWLQNNNGRYQKGVWTTPPGLDLKRMIRYNDLPGYDAELMSMSHEDVMRSMTPEEKTTYMSEQITKLDETYSRSKEI